MTRYAALPVLRPALATLDAAASGAEMTSARKLRATPPAGLVVGGDPTARIASIPLGCHSITYGRSGSGKTTAVAIPTLCSTMASRERPHLLVVDVKETLWRETSGWAASCGYRVRRIDLRSSATPCSFNPLEPAWRAYVRQGDEKRAEELVDELLDGMVRGVASKNDRYWDKAAARVIRAVFFGLCDVLSGAPSFQEIVEMAFEGVEEQRHFASMTGAAHAQRLRQAFNLHFNGIEKTWNCILDVLDSMLAFYTGAVGRAVAGRSSFDPVEDYLDGREPAILYLTVPDDSASANGYVSTLIASVYRRYVHEFECRGLEGKRPRAVMCVIDEAARLPRCCLTEIMAAGRSRRFYVHLFMQSFSQFLEEDRYTREEAEVLVEQAEVAVYLSTVSERIGEDASAKSGGLLESKDLVALKQGEAIVARAGWPVFRTVCRPIEAYRELGLFKRKPVPRLEPALDQSARERGGTDADER